MFSYEGKPIIQVSTKASFHPNWASSHVQNGTPLIRSAGVGRLASTEMVRRYAHLAADHLAPYAERLSALRAVASETDGTLRHRPEKTKGPPSASP